MAGVLKKTTGLTGLAVSRNPVLELNAVYGRLLQVLGTLPNDYVYRNVTEQLVKDRQSVLKENISLESMEEKIGCGQMEELIVQAKNEVFYASRLKEWKPWESLMEQTPPHQWTWPPHN